MDLALRLHRSRPRLRARVARPGAFAALVRNVQATMDPAKVADTIIDWAAGWLPVPCWAVVAGPSAAAETRVLAARGLTASRARAVRRVADEVFRHAEHWSTDNLRVALRDGPAAAALGLALRGDQRVVAALVGLDRRRSARPPQCGDGASDDLTLALTPMGYALAAALRVERAEALTVTDDLTELYNARYLRQALSRELKRSLRTGRPVSLLFADLDRFKRVNDTWGHLLGSRALVETAVLLRASTRETDVVARYGGDEFALVLPDTDESGAIAVASRLRERVAAHIFLSQANAPLQMTLSVGIATQPPPPGSAEELLAAADRAMYWVKAHGRNGIHVADHDQSRHSDQHEETFR